MWSEESEEKENEATEEEQSKKDEDQKDEEETYKEAISEEVQEKKKKEKKKTSKSLEEQESKEETKPKWNDDSKLEDITRKYYEEFEVPEKVIKEAIQKLHQNLLFRLKQWKMLTEEEKKENFPLGLRKILDEAIKETKKEEKKEEKPLKKQKLETLLEWQTFIDEFGDKDIDENEWKESKRGTLYANELLNASEKDLGADVQIIEMDSWLQKNEKYNTNLFVRKCQRELWIEVLSNLEEEPNNNAIVTGNPGIGKSRSMAFLLRLLLKKGKKVIYETRKDEKAFAFIPKENKYEVWKTKDFKPGSCALLQDSNNYYLIDPDKPNAINNVNAHTVLCSSPNKEHYKEFSKDYNTVMWCMPVWNQEELKAVKPYFKVENKEMTDDELEKNYNLFGGRIRIIFAKIMTKNESFNEIKLSIGNLEFWKLVNALSENGIDLDQSNKNTPSLLFVYVKKDVTLSYKYLKFNFTTSIASDHIRTLFAARYWKDIMNKLSQDSFEYTGNSTLNGKLFEILAITYLGFEGIFDAKNGNNKIDHQLVLKEGKKTEIDGSWNDFIQFCLTLNPISDTNSERKIAYPIVRNQPVFDFMDAKDRAYQITVGKDHSINRKKIQEIVKDMNVTSSKPLKLYHVVLEDKFDKFKWNYEGDFDINPEVKKLEKKTLNPLRDELKSLNSDLEDEDKEKLKDSKINKMKKDPIVKGILKLKGIDAETSEDIEKGINDCLKIYKIFIPKNPPKVVEEILNKLLKLE